MKRYAIGLITGALLAISAMMFIGAQNKNLGHITADSIKLVSPFGETMIMGGAIFTYNTDGKETVYLGTATDGSGWLQVSNDGSIETLNAEGKKTVYLGTDEGGGGHLSTSNADGKETAYLGTGEGGVGHLKTQNQYGVMTGYFGTNKDNDGVIGLYDRYGNVGWAAFGKK